MMRGHEENQGFMFSYLSPEERVPADEALRPMSRTFDRMYAKEGRPSIPPERLLKSQLLIALYTIRSETLFCEQFDYSRLYRWFSGMTLEERSFDQTSFTKNRDRLLKYNGEQHKSLDSCEIHLTELGAPNNLAARSD